MASLSHAETWIALLTLTALEIVLGIDNIVFISIMSGKLPEVERPRARTLGLGAAMLTRVLLLLSLAWIIRLTGPLFGVLGRSVSGRDLILAVGGLFLLANSTREIHERLEGEHGQAGARVPPSPPAVVVQIGLLDIIFSLDSVITAVGMAQQVWVMIAAVIVAVCIMMAASGAISGFVNEHPTIRMLALSFLLLIGFSLVAEALGLSIPKGYIYFAMGFSVFVEMLNLRLGVRAPQPVRLRDPYAELED